MALTERAQKAIEKIDDIIDTEYAPERMTPEEAVEFLEEIAANIEGKIDALKEENGLD